MPSLSGPCIQPADHSQAARRDRREKFFPGPKAKVLRQIGQDQPPFAPGLQMLGQPGQEAFQHPAVGIENRRIQCRARSGGYPRRIADHQRSPSGWEQIGLHHLHPPGEAQPLHIVAGARQRAGMVVGRHHVPDSAPGKNGGQHAGTGADVEGRRCGRQRRFGRQGRVFAAHR